jgi:ABC-type multidrug transport system fused ATPase/permease subunit
MGYSYKVKDLKFDFSDGSYLSHWDFMLSEFFKASKEVKDKFRDAYIKEYGIGPYNHMIRSHWYSWENGSRNVSDTQSYRIYSLMPKLLDDAGKYRLGMNEFMMSIKSTIKDFEKSRQKTFYSTKSITQINDLVEIFKTELDKIKTLNLTDIKPRIISLEEKEEALQISKYILKIKLQKTFDQIERDFKIFFPFMSEFKRGLFSAKYSIKTFNLDIDITNKEIENVYIPKFDIEEIKTNNSYKDYSDNYLANELIFLNKEFKKAVSNSFLNITDIQLFLEQYKQLTDTKNLVNMNSTYQGEGGELILKVELKPFKLLIFSILMSFIKLLIYALIIISLITLAINTESYILLILGSVLLGSFAFELISEEIKKLKLLIKEFKTYGE